MASTYSFYEGDGTIPQSALSTRWRVLTVFFLGVRMNIEELSGWLGLARALNRAGRTLRSRGSAEMNRKEIVKVALKGTEYAESSILPSDYCYNMINAAPESCKFHIFEWTGRARYRYLGPHFRYTGVVRWKGWTIGTWRDGELRLDVDPRKG